MQVEEPIGDANTVARADTSTWVYRASSCCLWDSGSKRAMPLAEFQELGAEQNAAHGQND